MVSYVRSLFFSSCYLRMASINIIRIGAICLLPFQCYCNPKISLFNLCQITVDLFSQTTESHIDDFLKRVDGFDQSQNSLEEGKRFLASLIKEINSQYGLSLTINDACQFIRENMRLLNIPLEIKGVILNTIKLYSSNGLNNFNHQKLKCSAMIANGLYWPTPWGYLDLINEWLSDSSKLPLCNVNETELPSDIYIGGVELLAGALCMIVGTVIPPFYAAGTILLGDGANRVFNGVSQHGEERRNSSNYVSQNFERLNCN